MILLTYLSIKGDTTWLPRDIVHAYIYKSYNIYMFVFMICEIRSITMLCYYLVTLSDKIASFIIMFIVVCSCLLDILAWNIICRILIPHLVVAPLTSYSQWWYFLSSLWELHEKYLTNILSECLVYENQYKFFWY